MFRYTAEADDAGLDHFKSLSSPALPHPGCLLLAFQSDTAVTVLSYVRVSMVSSKMVT